jgi:LuxR family maltose regulon positive regulatory protein
VLATKLFAPSPRARLVARPRLFDQLDTTLDGSHRLTLLSAPAGFGKTMLLSAWLTHFESSSIRVGWLSLDEDDNDLARFLAHLTAALRRSGIDVDPVKVGSAPGTSTSIELTEIVNEVVRAADDSPATQWILVFDDYHTIETPDVHEAMAFLLDHLPNRLHLVMATRSDPPMSLARLRSRGQLTEVRAADLRFTPPEVLEFFNSVMELDLSDDDARALEERTEGWVAGLQLAALSLRGMREHEEVTRFIEAFTGSNRFVIDYLADEVLARQSGAVRDFLLLTAILDDLTGSLCDAVTAGDGSGRMLEELERGNLFVVPLDDQRCWYRYHHLFADVLRAHLLAEHPREVSELHRRASAWYAAHNLPIPAVRHALAAEEFGRAAHLMEEALADMRRARQDNLLLTWMKSLPESVVRRNPVLSIWFAWSRLMAGDLDAMELWLQAAEVALAAGAEDPDLAREWVDTEDLRTAPATISMYRASLAQARGDVAGTVRHARETLDLAGPEDHLIRAQGSAFLGLAAWADGNIAEALETFGAAVRSLHAAGNLVDELDATIVLADMWVALGRPSRARELYERSLQRATADGEPYPRATADLHVGLAEIDIELNDLTSARQHLETAQVLAQRASITENRHRWFVAMAVVRAALGDFDAAAHLLDEAEGMYRRGFYPEIRPIAAIRARIHLAQGNIAAADDWVREQRVTSADEPRYLSEYDHLTLVRLLLARHRQVNGSQDARATGPSSLDAALALIDRILPSAEPSRPGSVIEILTLRALIHHARGDRQLALDDLEQALARTPEPESYARLFLDEGEPMLALLHEVSPRVGEHDTLGRHARRLLGAAGISQQTARTGDPHALADPLSDRELDVLRLLDTDLTGPQIARELYIALNTMRTHTKRIFTKLDVNTRVAAVRRAREHGLL